VLEKNLPGVKPVLELQELLKIDFLVISHNTTVTST